MNRFILAAAAALALLGPFAGHAQPVVAPTYQGQDGQTKEAIGTFPAQGVTARPTGASADQVQGNAAAGAVPAGNPVQTGCIYNSTLPTYVDGRQTACQADSRGRQLMVIANGAGTSVAAVSSGSADGVSNPQSLQTASVLYVFNGTTWDRMRGTTEGAFFVDSPSAAAASAIVPSTALNAVSVTAKAAAGNFYGATLQAGTAAGFLVVANLTTAPASGTALTAPQVLYCVPVAASGVATAGSGGGIPDRATVGITILFSTACATYTPVATPAVHIRARAM